MKTLLIALATLPLLAVGAALAETPIIPQDEDLDLITPQSVLSRNAHAHPGWTWMTERHAIFLLNASGYSVLRLEKAGSSWRGKAIKDHLSYHVAINRYASIFAHLDKKSRMRMLHVAAGQTQREAIKASKIMLMTLNGLIAVPVSQQAPTGLAPGKPVATVMGEAGWTWMRENHVSSILATKGYTNIHSLSRDAKGIWRGKAIHDGLALNVSMDIYANVETQPESHGGLAQASPSSRFPFRSTLRSAYKPGKPVATMMGEIGLTWMKENHVVRNLATKGYTNIHSLSREAQGIWRAKAIHDGLALNVAMDIYANVETQPESHGGLAQGSLSN